MFSQNALDNAQRLFKALAAREPNLDEPISEAGITDVAVQIGLEGDDFDSALDYAANQGWFEDAEVDDDASWVSLTPAGLAAAKILILPEISKLPAAQMKCETRRREAAARLPSRVAPAH